MSCDNSFYAVRCLCTLLTAGTFSKAEGKENLLRVLNRTKPFQAPNPYLAVLDQANNVLKAIVAEEDRLQNRPVVTV